MTTGNEFLTSIINKVVFTKTKGNAIIGYTYVNQEKIKVKLTISHHFFTNKDEFQAIISISYKDRAVKSWGCIDQAESIEISCKFERLRVEIKENYMCNLDDQAKKIRSLLNY